MKKNSKLSGFYLGLIFVLTVSAYCSGDRFFF